MKRTGLNNPFVIAGDIPAEYFCDRTHESEQLVRYLVNHNNVVLISPRRMGKSGLIRHCFKKKELKDNYSTIYLDILQTNTLKEFVYLLGKAVYENLVPKTTKWLKNFLQTLKSIQGNFTVDAMTAFPSFNFMIGEMKNPLLTLEEIFTFIENFDKRVVIAIDEFQQITHYPEKNIEALLRGHIQTCGNVNFIYSGSQRHIMQEMFLQYSRPFYMSSTMMILEPIPEDIYTDFGENLFKAYGKCIERQAVEETYRTFQGFTYYLQKTLNMAFFETPEGERCDTELIHKVIHQILDDNSTPYRELLANMGERVKELLYAIALEGEARNLTSAQFIQKYSLLSSSSVQSALRQLIDKDFVTKADNTYALTDKFFGLWIRRHFSRVLF